MGKGGRTRRDAPEASAVADAPITRTGLRRLSGTPLAVARQLRVFSKTSRLLSSRQSRMIDLYAKRWVALYRGEVVAHAATFATLLAQIRRHRWSRDQIIVRFIESNHRTLIL